MPVYIWCILQQIENDLYKIGRPDLENEWKLILWNVFEPLAYALTHLSAFGPVVVHLPGENLILPYFSSLSIVAILGCESHSQAGSATVDAEWL